MNDMSGPKFISIDFIKTCYDLLDKYKIMDKQAIGERMALPDGHFYLELRANGNLVLCDNRIYVIKRRIKSNTYRYDNIPMGIATMLSRYIDLLTKEGYFDKD